ncbi:MAG: amidophosphoribosyltransferase [Spirochaetales bacterium]
MVYRRVSDLEEKIGHYCGVVGLFSQEETNIPETLFFPLFSLQHRGQESCGIAYRKGKNIVAYKDLGMVSAVLGKYLKEKKYSRIGIGHVRYSTQGGNRIENVQPLVVNCNKGTIALAHNGNILNSARLKQELFQEGSIFQTTSDTELILHLLSRSPESDFLSALIKTLNRLQGAYSFVMIWDDTLIGIRDPMGFRPLYVGRKGPLHVLASETCALDILKVEEYRSVNPGEIILIRQEGVESISFAPPSPRKQCIFELIYFSRPDSYVFDVSVHQARKRMGAALARQDMGLPQFSADIVIPVPDSGTSAALGYAEESHIPFELGLARNHYTGRSFIMPTTNERELVVRMKLHPIREVLQGKRVVLVDDSLVRGTTSKILVQMIREAGAREVHLRLSSPELRWPCFFGIDIPTRTELISNHHTPEEIAKLIGADSVRFLEIPNLQGCIENPHSYCYACFNGEYPYPIEQERLLDGLPVCRC